MALHASANEMTEQVMPAPSVLQETAASYAVAARMPSTHMLRGLLGEHGPKAKPVELKSYAAYLATGGALALDEVSAHPLERV